ncbi:hypothetical protein N0V85_007261 [Neurospora sp. IMI 360204]|nr:hypothetical protein N0V85_007261 [Neurospora sp. IMI 360204]
MSTELPKTPPSSPNPRRGANDEVIDTPEALRRLAKRVKGILCKMNEKSNVFDSSGDNSGDPFGVDNTRQNGNMEVSAEAFVFDMSDFGCHEHVEEAKGSQEQREERVPANGTPSDIKGIAKLAGPL